MTNAKTTKRALLSSAVALLLCFAMLLGTTFAWFTDSATSGTNQIQAGNLKVDIVDKDDASLVGDKLKFQNKDGETNILWEPGVTFRTQAFQIKNNGNLALKYRLSLNGITGSSKLLEVISFSIVKEDGTAVDLANFEGTLTTAGALSDVYYIQGAMASSAGNEYQGLTLEGIGVTVLATQLTYENDSFGDQYDKDATYPVGSIKELQDAINNAVDGDVIQFTSDLEGNITIPQKADVKFTIDGNGNRLAGVILVDGKSATLTTAGVTIKNVNFVADSISADACIQLGDGTNVTRYTCNVTVEGCTFDVLDAVGVKSYTGGDKNLTILDCTATARAHSLAQLKGIDGVLVKDCTVNSVRGINFNNSDNIVVENCTIDVQKYAVRFGESANTTVENYAIIDSTIVSDNGDGDAAIVLRAGATNANLTITNTAITANVEMSGHENANVVIK